MIEKAAVLTLCCVLFISMGLSEAIQDRVGFKHPILSCPKCLTFWAVLFLCIVQRADILLSLAAAFFCSYAALWLTLFFDGMTVLYNMIYEKYNETDTKTETSEDHSSSGEVS